jgi:hypothetical protein
VLPVLLVLMVLLVLRVLMVLMLVCGLPNIYPLQLSLVIFSFV